MAARHCAVRNATVPSRSVEAMSAFFWLERRWRTKAQALEWEVRREGEEGLEPERERWEERVE